MMNATPHSDYEWSLAKSYDGYLRVKLHLFGDKIATPDAARLLLEFDAKYDRIWIQSGTSRKQVEAAYTKRSGEL